MRRAPARPEWSVASDAEGGSGERREPFETHRTAEIVDEEPGQGEAASVVPRPRKHRVQRGAQRGARGVERPRAFDDDALQLRAGYRHPNVWPV